jgi:hypothetical protein
MTVGPSLPSAQPGWVREAPPAPRLSERLLGGGTDGNERFTALAGGVLFILLAVVGVTILRVRQLMWMHLFVGLVVVPPVALKLATTGYRFTRYYTHDPSYRRKGPPPMPLRVLAPPLVLSTLIVFATGVFLLLAGPGSRGEMLPVHKISFFVWLALAAPHVLAHLPATGRGLRGEWGAGDHAAALGAELPGRSGRTLALAGALAGGAVLGVLLIPEFGTWISAAAHFHHGEH